MVERNILSNKLISYLPNKIHHDVSLLKLTWTRDVLKIISYYDKCTMDNCVKDKNKLKIRTQIMTQINVDI